MTQWKPCFQVSFARDVLFFDLGARNGTIDITVVYDLLRVSVVSGIQ